MKAMTAMAMVAAMMMSMPAMAAMEKDSTERMEKKANYWFSKMDANKDGKISKDEHEKFGEEMFSEADKNNDGTLTKEEVKAQKQAEHKEMKEAMGAEHSMR